LSFKHLVRQTFSFPEFQQIFSHYPIVFGS
jgi:hypothetical protein